MRAHWFGASSSVIALVMGLSAAHAQDATGAPAYVPPPAPGTNTAPASTTQVEVGPVQTRAAVTPEEQTAQAAAIQRRADQLAQRLTKMLDESRRDKDIMRANCVNRKLTEVNANTRNIQQRAQALRDANATNDAARRSHEYTVLTVLGQKLESLDQEATQCLGQGVYEPGASQVITTIPANISTAVDPSTSTSPSSVGAPPSFTSPPATLRPNSPNG